MKLHKLIASDINMSYLHLQCIQICSSEDVEKIIKIEVMCENIKVYASTTLARFIVHHKIHLSHLLFIAMNMVGITTKCKGEQ